MRQPSIALLLALCVVAVARDGRAEPPAPSGSEPDALAAYAACVRRCEHGALANRATCLEVGDGKDTPGCGTASPGWDKNGDGRIDVRDYELMLDALAGRTCVEDGIVKHELACGECADNPAHDADDCVDADRDGFLAWEERLFGTDDGVDLDDDGIAKPREVNQACETSASCGGFTRECRYLKETGRSLCRDRACAAGGACRAFSLTTVSQDANEVIVHVNFEYAPTPVRVMELYIDYDPILVLSEARGLEALSSAGKSVRTLFPGTGRARLLVSGTSSTLPIEPGPIIELLFKRRSPGEAHIDFVKGPINNLRKPKAIAPDPSRYNEQLIDDTLWGEGLVIPGLDLTKDPRVALVYDFEDPRQPLPRVLNRAVSAETLCEMDEACRNDSRRLGALKALQSGVQRIEQYRDGVYGKAGWLSGTGDHLDLPIVLSDTSRDGAGTPAIPVRTDLDLTVSFWFSYEPKHGLRPLGPDDLTQHGQVLFSHHAPHDGRSRFGLAALQRDETTYDLYWFVGDLLTSSGLSAVQITSRGEGADAPDALEANRWHHFAVAMDATRRAASVYVDGNLLASELVATAYPQCPQFEPQFKIFEEGENLGTVPSSNLWYSASDDGLSRVLQVDAAGMGFSEVVRDPKTSAQEPDYSPALHKLAYISNKAGDYEVWIAEADGSKARQVTRGFGDTAQGVFARRPRWTPDGSALIFESNVFAADQGYNGSKSYQLYRIPFEDGEPAVLNIGSSEPSAEMVFSLIDVTEYAITSGSYHSTNAHVALDVERKQVVLFTRSDRVGNSRLAKVVLTDNLRTAEVQTVEDASVPSGQLTLLAARTLAPPGQSAQNFQLVARDSASFTPATDIGIAAAPETRAGVAGTRFTLTYLGRPVEDYCWEQDDDRDTCLSDLEDRDGNGACELEDCHPAGFKELFLRVTDGRVSLPTGNATAAGETPGAIPTTTDPDLRADHKDLQAFAYYDVSGAAYAQVELRTPLNNHPVAPGATLGSIWLEGAADADALSATRRKLRRELYVTRHLDSQVVAPQRFLLTDPFTRVTGGAFSPDARRLALTLLEGARPSLVVTKDLQSTAEAFKLQREPATVQRVAWTAFPKAIACNRLGAYRDPASGLMTHTLRGRLDDLRVYTYLRSGAALRSEAARGFERVGQGSAASESVTCTAHVDCPPYQLCDASTSTCRTVPCDDPDDPADDPQFCEGGGECRLMPVAYRTQRDLQWVCAADCRAGVESDCYQQECLNGPCRFCGASSTCNECRTVVETYGEGKSKYSVQVTQGCPDQNSFFCDRGSCLTECYAFEGGASRYLCDETIEYCYRGRCKLFDWSWPELSPMSFAGLGDMEWARYRNPYDPNAFPSSAVVDTATDIEIRAFASSDFGVQPLLLVEGMVTRGDASVHDGQWFEIGRVAVHNTTFADADPSNQRGARRAYHLSSPFALTKLRLRMIQPPTLNFTSGATGLGEKEKDFCRSHASAAQCARTPAASIAHLGYPVGIPEHVRQRECQLKGGTDCDFSASQLEYLRPGEPAIVVTSVSVAGQAALIPERNLACSYAGGVHPSANGRRQPLYFGDPSRERSNQKAARYPDAQAGAELVSLDLGSLAVLNCALNVEGVSASADTLASAVYDLGAISYRRVGATKIVEKPAAGNRVAETGAGCMFERGQPGRETFHACYEWEPGVIMDSFTTEEVIYGTLEFNRFTSFGWDR